MKRKLDRMRIELDTEDDMQEISIMGTKNPIIGRGVIVHAKLDGGGQPVGNAGSRIACGVIGVANVK